MKTRFRSVFLGSCAVHAAFLIAIPLSAPRKPPALSGALQFKVAKIAPVEKKKLVAQEPEPEKVPPKPKEIKKTKKKVPKKKVAKKRKKKKKLEKQVVRKEQLATTKAVTKSEPIKAPQARATKSQIVSYQSQLMAWLERHKRYPRRAQRRGIEGEALLYVEIARNGKVLDSRIERSSEARILDREVMQMVSRANPLPSVPKDYPGETIAFRVPVRFILQ